MFGAKKLQLGQNHPTSLHITAHVTVCVLICVVFLPVRNAAEGVSVSSDSECSIIQHALTESLGVYVLVQGQM